VTRQFSVIISLSSVDQCQSLNDFALAYLRRFLSYLLRSFRLLFIVAVHSNFICFCYSFVVPCVAFWLTRIGVAASV